MAEHELLDVEYPVAVVYPGVKYEKPLKKRLNVQLLEYIWFVFNEFNFPINMSI